MILYAGNFYLSNLNPRNLDDSYIIFERWGGRGQYDDTYSGGPPYYYDLNAPFGHIGVHAHEFGHFFWTVDLYNSPYTIVDWCLMGDACDLSGTLGGTDIQRGSCPGPINAEFRSQQGWITVQDLTSDVLPATITYSERTPTVYRKQIGTSEYFYAESKRFQGFSGFLPGHNLGHDGGLLIWQVRRRTPDTLNVYLERADNVTDFDYYNGEPNDIFPGPTVNNRSFNPLSTPNSSKLDGSRSGFAMTDISLITGTGVSAKAYINYLVSNSTDATAFNNGRKLVRDSAGKYHLVYESGGEIYYQYSNDGVNSWLGLTRLSSGNGNNRYPCIVERSGRLYVVWQRKNGTKYDIYFRKYTSSAWQSITTLQSDVGITDPLPVIICPGTDKLTVVYRDQKLSKLRYKTSTNDGGSWTTGDVPSTGTNDNSPTLAPTVTYWGSNSRSCLAYANSSGSGTIYYQYYRNGPDSTGWGPLIKNLSQIVPSSYNSHKKPSIAPSGTSGDKRLHVVWEARSGTSGNYYVIIHRKATDWYTWPSVYSATYYEEQQQPSITGLHDGTAELLFRMVTQNYVYKMHYDGSYWGGPVFIDEGTNPSVSVGNTTAKYVWTYGPTSPYRIKTSTETLSKTNSGPLAVAYHRSTAVIDTATGAWFEVRINQMSVKTKTGKEFILPFATAQEDPLTLTPTKAFDNLSSTPVALPTEAESLLVSYWNSGNSLSAIKNASNSLNVEIIVSTKSGATVRLAALSTASENLRETKLLLTAPISTFAGQEINVRTQVTGVATKPSILASLGHLYEVVEGASLAMLSKDTEAATPRDFALAVYPNPFNPTTHIQFTLPVEDIITLRIYNLQGQLVRKLLHGYRSAGKHTIPWDGRDDRGIAAASGIYFMRLQTTTLTKVSKLTLVR